MTPDSTVPSDTDRLAEIRARLDAATPGPWHRKGKAVLGPREERDLGTGPAALLHTGMPYDGPNGRCGANAELAANAPDDLAFLLGELDDAQRLFDALGSEAAEELKAAHATLTTLQGRLDTAEGQLATVGRIIEPRDPNWKPLSERYPEHFKRVTDEERARRNGWDEGVSLMSQRIKAVLDGKSTEDYDGVIACTGCGKCSYCRKRGVTAADVLGLGEGDGQ
jgi:hypothetical protein